MPFDITEQLRVAVVGGGVAGLSAALVLGEHAKVTLFEAERRLGGHARTVMAGRRGDRAVDTGFIVFNHATYPHLGRLFRELDVPLERSDMSFGASLDGGRIEYAFSDPRGLFAQPSNALSLAFLGMLRDAARFGRRAEATAKEGQTVGELIGALGLGLGDGFRRFYLRPLCGAIWSTPEGEVENFPATFLVRFLRNHGLLGLTGQHPWWTVQGGAAVYVERLARRLAAIGVELRAGAPVTAVRRDREGVSVTPRGGLPERFDRVVLACHPDQSLRLLAEATGAERRLLGAIRYRPNRALLHADPTRMPRRRACWSSWVYRSAGGTESVTYWMNRLQNLPADDPLFVSLNPERPIRDELVYDETEFHHPVYDLAAIRAQEEIAAIQGANRTWYAGAWLRNGFHEDGIASAMRVARAMGVPAW